MICFRKISCPDERGATSGRWEDECFRSGGVQDEEAARGDRATAEKNGEDEEDRAGGNAGRSYDGRDQGVQGNADVSVVQSEAERRCAQQVFSRILLWLFAYALRD